jgi:hypothetical protein
MQLVKLPHCPFIFNPHLAERNHILRSIHPQVLSEDGMVWILDDAVKILPVVDCLSSSKENEIVAVGLIGKEHHISRVEVLHKEE